jgi:hypothetical protein
VILAFLYLHTAGYCWKSITTEAIQNAITLHFPTPFYKAIFTFKTIIPFKAQTFKWIFSLYKSYANFRMVLILHLLQITLLLNICLTFTFSISAQMLLHLLCKRTVRDLILL